MLSTIIGWVLEALFDDLFFPNKSDANFHHDFGSFFLDFRNATIDHKIKKIDKWIHYPFYVINETQTDFPSPETLKSIYNKYPLPDSKLIEYAELDERIEYKNPLYTNDIAYISLIKTDATDEYTLTNEHPNQKQNIRTGIFKYYFKTYDGVYRWYKYEEIVQNHIKTETHKNTVL